MTKTADAQENMKEGGTYHSPIDILKGIGGMLSHHWLIIRTMYSE